MPLRSATLTLIVLTLTMGPALGQPKSKDTSGVAHEIAAVEAQWANDLHSKKLEEITALYAPDAVFLSGGSGRVTGRPAIHDLCKTVMAAITSSINLHSVVVERSGDLAYDSGDYDETLAPTGGGAPQQARGSYLMIFKRQPDGKWLILEQVWTEQTAPSH